MYHRGSAGSISYAEFRHLGKEGILGKYATHFHLVGDTMRGASVAARLGDFSGRCTLDVSIPTARSSERFFRMTCADAPGSIVSEYSVAARGSRSA
jgi:hypothetical protein